MAIFVLAMFDVPPTLAERCECDGFTEAEAAGVLYRDTRVPGFDEIVGMLAPVLWFSGDEPLLVEGLAVPMPLPCDVPADHPVVYYQVADVVLRGDEEVSEPPQSDPRFFEKVRVMSIIFFFYYPMDRGMGGHTHDLESVEFDVGFRREDTGCNVVYLGLVTGRAHGQELFANRLRPDVGTRYPITIMVEEGKHASCTDRNSDGLYTPGYDTNQYVNDAWGVRDVFGAGFLFTGNYSAYMSKNRSRETRLLPPTAAFPPCIPASLSSLQDPENSLGRYELRPGSELGVCARMGAPHDSAFLHVNMVKNGIGNEVSMRQHGSGLEGKFVQSLASSSQLVPGLSLRWDEQRLGLVVNAFGIDLGEGWLVGRVGFLNGISTELMFTRSASRWSDGYVSGGWEWKDAQYKTINGQRVETQALRNDPVWETGMKFRVGLPEGKIRWLFLNHSFAGARFGVRFNGVDRLKNARLTVELGAGVW